MSRPEHSVHDMPHVKMTKSDQEAFNGLRHPCPAFQSGMGTHRHVQARNKLL